MTARTAARILSFAGLAACTAAACGSIVEIPIETPIQAKLDVSAFSRVLVAGFVAGGSDDVDTNLETVRLLRSQLRTKSNLRVIDADPMPLVQVAKDELEDPASREAATATSGSASPAERAKSDDTLPEIKTEKDLEPYERLFADADFWKRIGEEYQNPLIVTGTVLFAPQSRAGFVQREQEVFDQLGRRRVVPVRTYQERKGFILAQKIIFIDGRSGATIHSETFREERLYNQNQNTPALSSYFELMDGIVPKFLNTLSTQKVRGTRVLLQ
jgi:hypothetical protein